MAKFFIQNRKGIDLCVVVKKPEESPHGIVFIEHGLSGNKEEPHLQSIADTFYNNGFTVVVFDASNSTGESGHDKTGITFTGHYQDLKDVIEWAGQQSWYKEPFVLSGHSLGGMAVIYYAEKHPQKVRALIPVAPALSGKIFEFSRKQRSLHDFTEWKKNGFYEKISNSNGRKLIVPINLLEDIKKYDCFNLCTNIKAPTVIIAGEKDESVPLNFIKDFYNQLKCRKELKVIANCPHVVKTPDDLNALRQNLEQAIEFTA